VIRPLRVAAPAKLNLRLRVVGRRPDGYHELDSTLVLLELADRLLLMPGAAGFRVGGAVRGSVPLGDDNLAWRGLLAGAGGAPPDLHCLTLEKRIPTGAGLGGGSSDAAAAWRLGRFWQGVADRPTVDDLVRLAQIGADVPFFAAATPAARIRGIGERVEPMPPARAAVVLLHPSFDCSTAAVFAELRPAEWGTDANDLLAPALRLRPELSDLMEEVRSAGGEPRLSGSGSTIFSIADDPDRGAAVARGLRRRGHRVTLTATRTSAPDVEVVAGDVDADEMKESDR
jgi:4-diphosphocytidyl-2-C-methyl-D-erythritol kinase